MAAYVTFCLLITPSFNFLLFGYAPPYIIGVVYLISTEANLDNPAFIEIISIQPVYFMSGYAMFYLMQHRELRSFFALKASNQKSEQLLEILNSQSDSVIVISSGKEQK